MRSTRRPARKSGCESSANLCSSAGVPLRQYLAARRDRHAGHRSGARDAFISTPLVMRDGAPRHEIYALSLADGSVEPGWPVDVATAFGGRFDPTAQNQRGALALFGGQVFVPFGGLAGDCGDYHGMVLGVSTTRPEQGRELLDPGARRGHLGARRSHRRRKFAVRRDRQHLFRQGMERRRSRSPLRSRPRPPDRERDNFAPSNWKDLDNHDLDLGGTAPFRSTSRAPKASGS